MLASGNSDKAKAVTKKKRKITRYIQTIQMTGDEKMTNNIFLIQMICNQTGEVIETLDEQFETEEDALNAAEELTEDFAVSCESLGFSDSLSGKIGFIAQEAI